MRIELTKASALREQDWRRWSEIVEADPDLDSPFFRPEFVQSVASVRDDVEVARMVQDGEPVGFFAFQRASNGITAQSVAGRLSEFHGVVAAPETDWSPTELIRGCKLSCWAFDHLPASQSPFEHFRWGGSFSAFMDLKSGYPEYEKQQRARKCSVLKQVLRKSRKVERELGEIRFTMHTDDEAAWNSLLDWKTQQHDRTGVLEVFRYDWVVKMLRAVQSQQGSLFRSQFSTLHIDDRLAAVHFGMRSRRSLHIWFPAYSREYEKYSPGLILLLRMAEQAAEEGVVRIDFGRGEERYKRDFRSGQIDLLEGAVELRPAARLAKRYWHGVKSWIRSSPYRQQLEKPLIATRKIRQKIAFR